MSVASADGDPPPLSSSSSSATTTATEDDAGGGDDDADGKVPDPPRRRGPTMRGGRRALGSQELLMLPRQYGPKLERGGPPFPSMSHAAVYVLSATPSIEASIFVIFRTFRNNDPRREREREREMGRGREGASRAFVVIVVIVVRHGYRMHIIITVSN
jgi:hypothetical protein